MLFIQGLVPDIHITGIVSATERNNKKINKLHRYIFT